jgi:hypothetical protein
MFYITSRSEVLRLYEGFVNGCRIIVTACLGEAEEIQTIGPSSLGANRKFLPL